MVIQPAFKQKVVKQNSDTPLNFISKYAFVEKQANSFDGCIEWLKREVVYNSAVIQQTVKTRRLSQKFNNFL